MIPRRDHPLPGPPRLAALLLGAALLTAAPAAAQPWIGIELAPGATGVRVKRVYEESPGARAHLLAGDEVLAVDGHKVTRSDELIGLVAGHEPGSRLKLTVTGRSGRREVEVALEARPAPDAYQRSALLGK